MIGKLVCRFRGHKTFGVKMHHPVTGELVEVMQGCMRCSWHRTLV